MGKVKMSFDDYAKNIPVELIPGSAFMSTRKAESENAEHPLTYAFIIDSVDKEAGTITCLSLRGGITTTQIKSFRHNYFSPSCEVRVSVATGKLDTIKAYLVGGIKSHAEREIIPQLLGYGIEVMKHHEMNDGKQVFVPKKAELVVILADMGGHSKHIDRAVEQAKQIGIPFIRVTRREHDIDRVIAFSRDVQKMLDANKASKSVEVIEAKTEALKERAPRLPFVHKDYTVEEISPGQFTGKTVDEMFVQEAKQTCSDCQAELEDGKCLDCLTNPAKANSTIQDVYNLLGKLKLLMAEVKIKEITIKDDGETNLRLKM